MRSGIRLERSAIGEDLHRREKRQALAAAERADEIQPIVRRDLASSRPAADRSTSRP